MRGFLLAASVLIVMAWACVASAQGTATSLDIQPGARQNSMGAAGVALEADPADAMWWNPAALGFAEWHGVGYTRANLLPGLADLPYEYIAGAGMVRPGLGLGVSGTFLDYGQWSDGFSTWRYTEWSGAVAAGYRVTPELALGVTGKYVNVDFPSGSNESHTFGFDIGGLYRRTFAPARIGIGFNVQNLGPEMKFGSTSETSPLSRNFKLGGTVTLPMAIGSAGYEAGATAAVDWDHSLVTDGYDVLHYGVEISGAYRWWVRLAVRGGYYDDQLGDITDWTWGAGGRVAGLSLDYAQIPQARDSGLPNVEKWSIGLHTDALMKNLSAR